MTIESSSGASGSADTTYLSGSTGTVMPLAAARVTLGLNIAPSSISNYNTFSSQFASDIAYALNVTSTRIIVRELTGSGSNVYVTFDIIDDGGIAPQILFDQLKFQATTTGSKLLTASTTSQVIVASITQQCSDGRLTADRCDSSSETSKAGLIAGLVVGLFFACLIAILLIHVCKKRGKSKVAASTPNQPTGTSAANDVELGAKGIVPSNQMKPIDTKS
jgi:hypothetical protein